MSILYVICDLWFSMWPVMISGTFSFLGACSNIVSLLLFRDSLLMGELHDRLGYYFKRDWPGGRISDLQIALRLILGIV